MGSSCFSPSTCLGRGGMVQLVVVVRWARMPDINRGVGGGGDDSGVPEPLPDFGEENETLEVDL